MFLGFKKRWISALIAERVQNYVIHLQTKLAQASKTDAVAVDAVAIDAVAVNAAAVKKQSSIVGLLYRQ